MISSEQKTRQDLLIKLFNTAPIKKIYGMMLSYNEEGQAYFDLPYNFNFDHAFKGIHGGVFATLLDNAGWFTAASHYDCWIATVEFQTRLLEPVYQEDLYSIGKIIRKGSRIASCDMEVRTSKNRLVARGAGTFTTTNQKIEI